MSKQREALKLALDALESDNPDIMLRAGIAIREALKQPKKEPVLQDIEQYRIQMAGICTAAIGYWKEADSIHPDYDTLALRDVAKLYAKYDALYKTQPKQEPVAWMSQGGDVSRSKKHFDEMGFVDSIPLYTSPAGFTPLTDERIDALELPPSGTATVRDLVRIIERAHGIGEA